METRSPNNMLFLAGVVALLGLIGLLSLALSIVRDGGLGRLPAAAPAGTVPASATPDVIATSTSARVASPTLAATETPVGTATPVPVPTKTETPALMRYTVKEGETLGVIAERYSMSVDELVEMNDIPDRDEIYAGQVLWVPLPTVTPSMATTPGTGG